jgi:Immunity protein 30
MDRRNLAGKLYQSRIMRTPKEVKEFEEAQAELHATKDPAVLKDLFAAFDDSTVHLEVMWGLVHTVESFDLDVYLNEMAKAVPKMLPHAKDWALLLNQRVLNTKKAVSIYRRIVPTLPAKTRDVIRKLLEEIGETNPKLKEGVQEVLKEDRKQK